MSQDRFLFGTRTRFDCLLRKKVTKYGDITDNKGACEHHINNMKEALGSQHSKLLDGHIDKIIYARQSFV